MRFKNSFLHYSLKPPITGFLRFNFCLNSFTFEKKYMKNIFSLVILCISVLSFAQTKAPFTGYRSFDIVQGFSGSGTPHYYLDVKKNGDVHFGFVQVNQADGTETTEEMNAGKYNPKVMKVVFKKYKENFFVKFDKDHIYLTDKDGNIQKSEDCCSSMESATQDICTCESELYKR